MKDRLRQLLVDEARAGSLVTYREVAQRLDLRPPHTIQQVTAALERLMAEDAAAGRPLLAALCVSRAQEGLPGRGFFIVARELGLFSGDPGGPEATDFHAAERRRASDHYGGLGGGASP